MFLSTILVEYAMYRHCSGLSIVNAIDMVAAERGKDNQVSQLLPVLAVNFEQHDYLHTYVWQKICNNAPATCHNTLLRAKQLCKSELQDRHMLMYDSIVDACGIHELEWLTQFLPILDDKMLDVPRLYALFLATVACKPETMSVRGIAAQIATFSVEKRQFAESFPIKLNMSKEDVVCDIFATLMSIVDMWSDIDCYSFVAGVDLGILHVDKLIMIDRLALRDILNSLPHIKQDVLARKHCQTIADWLNLSESGRLNIVN